MFRRNYPNGVRLVARWVYDRVSPGRRNGADVSQNRQTGGRFDFGRARTTASYDVSTSSSSSSRLTVPRSFTEFQPYLPMYADGVTASG